MSAEDPLYLLTNPVKYRNAKIDLLSAQSSVLLSREIVKKTIEMRHSERAYKTKIANEMTQLKLMLQKFEERLPKTGGNRTRLIKKVTSGKRVVRRVTTNPIRDELDVINQKLRELGA